MLIFALLVATALAATSLPEPPQAIEQMPAYIETHGKALSREYALMRVADAHPGGRAASSSIVDAMTSHVHAGLMDADVHEQMKRAQHMHSRLVNV